MSLTAILIWVLLGSVAGWLAGLIVKGHGFGLVGNIIVGIIGAFLGGWLLNKLGMKSQVGGFNILSVLTASAGAIVLLFAIGLVKKSK